MYPLKLSPALKDYIWGGDRLKREYGIKSDLERVAEAWVLSCHPDGPSTVLNGEYEGLSLAEVIKKEGNGFLGKNAEKFEFFPILVKLIDAKSNLSVQVHPSDEYALKNEGQFGKTEMWFVMDCDENAYLYYGFNHEISAQEFKERIDNNTICDVLNKVPVKKGDFFFIEAGTIHAIGEGILIAEIQQNSNLTYRVYDYGRVGADGKPRELHVEKAQKVTTLKKPSIPYGTPTDSRLASCKYFTSDLISFEGEYTLSVDSDSFVSILLLEGEATACDIKISKGESLFIPANFGELTLKGNAKFIASRV